MIFSRIRGYTEYKAKKTNVGETLVRLGRGPSSNIPAQIPSLGSSVTYCRCYVLNNSLDSRLRALLPLFRAIKDDTGGMDWMACQLFHHHLQSSIPQPPAIPEPRVHNTYRRFLGDRMDQAERNRNNHEALASKLSRNETSVNAQRAAGFDHR